MAIWQLQPNLNRGELDPRAIGRVDLDAYYNGVRLATNVLPIPQGGLKKRPGMEFIGTALGDGRIENFSFNVEQNYLLVFTALRMQVYKDSVLVDAVRVITGVTQANPAVVTSADHGFLDGQTITISGVVGMTELNGNTFTVANAATNTFELSGTDSTAFGAYVSDGTATGELLLVTPWSLAQLADIDYIQSADTAIVTHPNIAPTSISRTSDTDWEVSTITLTNVPQFDYDDSLSPTPTSEVQTLLFTNMAEGDRYKLALEGILSDELVFGGNNPTNRDNIQKALQDLPNTGDTGITVTGNSPTFTVTFAGNSANDFELITGTAIFTANLAFNVAANETTPGVSRAEDVWSANRGWPTSCTFHEGRLFFGGSLSRPATLWGSRVNDFFNFEPGKGRDDESVSATLDTDQVNAIENIFSNRSLQVFTSGAEFFIRESPITPENIAVLPQTNLGSKRVRPVTIDGVTLFVQRTGKSVNQFVFLDSLQSNQTQSISTLAPHLILNPIQMSVQRGTESSDANYVYILNDDGSLTIFNTLIAENVQGFSTWVTDGGINSVAVVDFEAYFLVERVINSVTVFYIEKENNSLNTDSAVIVTDAGSATLTGLTHLNGETVKVKYDGAVMDDEIVVAGAITANRSGLTREAGLEFTPIIQTMPLNVALANGPDVFLKKKIQRIGIHVFESNGVIVNGQRIADKQIALNQFDPPEPQTGEFRIYVLGYSLDASVTITQTTPMDMTILSLGLEVAT